MPSEKPKPQKSAIKDMAGTISTAIIIMIVLTIFVFPKFWGSKEAKSIVKNIDSLAGAMESYRSEFGSYPGGNSREISAALRGENDKKKKFTDLEKTDDTGRLLDPWGNPFQFYVSNDGFVIRSPGPNGEFEKGDGRKGDDFYYGSQ